MFYKIRTSSRRLFRRRSASHGAVVALGVLGIAAYLAASTGVLPTPALLARLFGDAAALLGVVDKPDYPCQGGACACSSAYECWTTCQCHTLDEKVAWARRYHVEIPACVDLSGLDVREAESPTPNEPACPLCCEAEPIDEIEIKEDPASTSCCGSKPSNSRPSGSCCDDEAINTLPTLSALGCKGIQSLLTVAALPVVVSPSHVLLMCSSPMYIALPYDGGGVVSRVLDVVPPPPRSAM